MTITDRILRQANHGLARRPQHLLPPRTLAKWCAYALVLLLPGSFIVLAVLWFYRRCA